MTHTSRLKIGISSCLLGQEVRFDGGHKRDAFLTEIARAARRVGAGVPGGRDRAWGRRARRSGWCVRVTPRGRFAWSRRERPSITPTRCNRWSARRVEALARDEPDLDGYVLKKDSPSCGMERVKTSQRRGMPVRDGRGLFATALIAPSAAAAGRGGRAPGDPRLRENFIERVFAYRRLKDLFQAGGRTARWSSFTPRTRCRCSRIRRRAYRELGRLVARGREVPRRELRDDYETLFMATLAAAWPRRAGTRTSSTHMVGHLKKQLDAESKRELLQPASRSTARGLVPLVVPLTLIGTTCVSSRASSIWPGSSTSSRTRGSSMLRNHV